MPPRNHALAAAVRLFNCEICDKGYPRQLDYEGHLRSYDHNHRQRLADLKKLTASNDTESSKPKAGPEMRSIDIEGANKKPGVGSRFKKIGGAEAAPAEGSRFKKVGVAIAGKDGLANEDVVDKKEEDEKKESDVKVGIVSAEDDTNIPIAAAVPDAQTEVKAEEDTVMAGGDEEEVVTSEEYDFTKPTGCEHAGCPGCVTDGIWSREWVAVGMP